MLRPLQMAHNFLSEILTEQDVAVDATMGNGYDTLFLSKFAGQVYSFDIQERALIQTQKRLSESDISNVKLHLLGHEYLADIVKYAKAVIFNLGYLPSADKSVITLPATTLEAIRQACDILVVGGRIAIMVYYGHEGGKKEKDAVLSYVSLLPQQKFTVAVYKNINQINHPPFVIMIEKLGN